MKANNTTRKELSARERIVLTAHKLFYKHGIRATGVDRVIAESRVTKVTFYRHFPSKNDLILTFLEYRHQQWMTWFRNSLNKHGGRIEALVPALSEWFNSRDFRGCAFINSAGELANTLTEVRDISSKHKQEMTSVIEQLLPERYSQSNRGEMAAAIALAVDGAIVRAQIDGSADEALRSLDKLLMMFLEL